MRIRKIGKADIAQCLAIYNYYIKNTCHTFEEDVDKEFLCRGIGGELLAALEREARRAGIENLVSLITSENENSLRFHERHGFSCAGELKNVGLKFGQRHSVKYYLKSLR